MEHSGAEGLKKHERKAAVWVAGSVLAVGSSVYHTLHGEREILLAKGGTGRMSKAGGTADLVFIRPGAEGILRRGVFLHRVA